MCWDLNLKSHLLPLTLNQGEGNPSIFEKAFSQYSRSMSLKLIKGPSDSSQHNVLITN